MIMEKLAEHLARSGKTQSEFADEIGVHRSVMSRYLSNAARPGRDVAVRIERITGGDVPVSAWSSDHAQTQAGAA